MPRRRLASLTVRGAGRWTFALAERSPRATVLVWKISRELAFASRVAASLTESRAARSTSSKAGRLSGSAPRRVTLRRSPARLEPTASAQCRRSCAAQVVDATRHRSRGEEPAARLQGSQMPESHRRLTWCRALHQRPGVSQDFGKGGTPKASTGARLENHILPALGHDAAPADVERAHVSSAAPPRQRSVRIAPRRQPARMRRRMASPRCSSLERRLVASSSSRDWHQAPELAPSANTRKRKRRALPVFPGRSGRRLGMVS